MAEQQEAGAEDRTEEATPERREDFREKGQVVVSRELTSVLALAACTMFLAVMAPRMMSELRRLFTVSFEAIATRRIDHSSIAAYAIEHWAEMLFLTLPLFLVGGAISGAVTLLQSQFNWSWQRVSPDWSRLSPLAGLKRMVSMQALVELVKGIAKLGAVGGVAYLVLRGEWAKVPELMIYPIEATWGYWGEITKVLCYGVVGLLLFVAGGDYLYSFISFERQIKMTKQEVKEEFKRREIDPQLKGRQRRMARDMMTKKTLAKTKEATVIITNPTHYAIALKYELGMGAPIVLAKGIDYLALRMREVAKEGEIPIIENRPLARELYASVKEGEEIPDKLYKAVAEIIRYVFRLKGKALSRKEAN